MLRYFYMIAMFAIVLCSQPAHADSSVPFDTGASIASSGSGSSSALDNIYVNYFGIYHGPRINQIDKPTTLNHDGSTPKGAYSDGTNDQNFDSELTTAWMINPDWGIGLTTQFNAYPVQGYGITMGDFGLKTFDRHIVNNANWHVYANLNLQHAFGYDAERNVGLKIKTTPYFRYDFSNSRFSVGSWNEVTYYAGAQFGNQYKLYADPYVMYQQWEKFAWTFAFEVETDHVATPRAGSYFQTSETDFMPGFTYVFSRKLIVNPFVQIFTGPNIAMNRTGLGVNISATL